MSDLPPGTLSRAEAAERLGISATDLDRLIAAGALETTPDGAGITQTSALIYMANRLSATVSQAIDPPKAPGGTLELLAMRVLLVLGLLAGLVQVFSLRDDNPIFPTVALLAGLGAALALATALARRQPDFSSANGMGTTLYGSRRTPDGVVGTAWVIVAMVPLVPYASYVILEEGAEKPNWSGVVRTTQYMLRKLPGICWPQAAPVMALSWAGVAVGVWALIHLG